MCSEAFVFIMLCHVMQALELLAAMRREQVEPNEIVYGGIIRTCCAAGQADKVRETNRHFTIRALLLLLLLLWVKINLVDKARVKTERMKELLCAKYNRKQRRDPKIRYSAVL